MYHHIHSGSRRMKFALSSEPRPKMKAVWGGGEGGDAFWMFLKVLGQVAHAGTHTRRRRRNTKCSFFYRFSQIFHSTPHLSWSLGEPGPAQRLHWYSDRLSNTSGWSKWRKPGRGFWNICRCLKEKLRPSFASSSCSAASEALGGASAHWRC